MSYLYVTTNRFTKDDASSARALIFCLLLKDLGKDVIVISLDELSRFKTHNHHGINLISLRNSADTLLSRFFNFIFHRKRLIDCINDIKKNTMVEGIFFYDIPYPSLFYLKRISKNEKVKLYHDSVEWYSPEQFNFKQFALPYILKNVLNKYLIDDQISVFAISNFLYNYFQSKGIHTIRIPILLDMNKISFSKSIRSDKLTLIYAGSPGKKDYLKLIIEAISVLNKDQLSRIEFHLFGVTKTQLMDVCGVLEDVIKKCGNSLIVRGKVTREEVFSQLRFADFTVLLRPSELRYAKAGFPTKVVESLATATPVICNLSSDLNEFLVNGENSIIVKDCTAESFSISLMKALELTFEERQKLCRNARKIAESKFDYRIYKDIFNKFINE